MAKAGKDPERRLTALAIKNISKPGRHADGGGLYLVVDPSGAKRWICRVVAQGRRRDIGLGGFTTVSLTEARERASEIRKSARSGGDPISERRAAKRIIPTFAQSILLVHDEHRKSWKNKKHQDQWISTLDRYAVPLLGFKRIDNIETADILKVLQPIWLEKPETARRIRQRMSTVFKWAKASGFVSGSNPVDDVELGLARQKDIVKNFAAIDYEEVPKFWNSLGEIETNPISILAFKFLILTASRTSEVLGARWSEINLEKGIWTIPAGRMKAGKEHRVPLGPENIKIIEAAYRFRVECDLIFPGYKINRPLSGMVFLMTLRRMKKSITAHGFRSAFRDWASETTHFQSDVCEMALAHSIKNKTEAAYRRGDLFDKRRDLALAWEKFVTSK